MYCIERSRNLEVQYNNIEPHAGLIAFAGLSYRTINGPSKYKTGNMIYPYAKAHTGTPPEG